MSAILEIKNLIVQHMPENLKESVMGVLKAIDSDLDDQGYEHSSDVDEAVKKLNDALCAIDEPSISSDDDDDFDPLEDYDGTKADDDDSD